MKRQGKLGKSSLALASDMVIAPEKTSFEIFRAGTRTASDGRTFVFSDKELDEIAESYNPNSFRAPLILSHNTFGRSDRELAHSELAFGAVEKVIRMGDRLMAFFNPIASEVKGWVEEGRILDRSASFYPPSSPNNPTPGKWSLRHVALLGKTPPAVKGMEVLQLDELLFDDGSEAIEFGGAMNNRLVADLFRGVRDFLIEVQGLEIAEELLPHDLLSELQEGDEWAEGRDRERGQLMADLAKEIDQIRSELRSLRANPNHQEELMVDQNYEELREELDRYKSEAAILKQQVAEERKERRLTRIASFQEKMQGRITPAMMEPIELSFGEETKNVSFSSFCESLSDWQLNYMEQLIGKLPVIVDFGERTASAAPGRGAARNSPAIAYDSASLSLHEKVTAYQRENPALSYSEVLELPEFAEAFMEVV
jgi:hypothetical protein